jgi:Cytochrome c
MTRNIISSLLVSSLAINFLSCDSGNQERVESTDEITDRIDTIAFKQAALVYSEGKQLFGRYCNTCHYAPEKQVFDQYTFDNLFQRLPPPAEDYFVKYISDSKALKASGNQYAKQVDEVYNSTYEHHFKDSLTTGDFTNLIGYIKIAAKQRNQ